jgi:hypothetical protein
MSANKKSTDARSASSTVTRELDQLRKKVKELPIRLEREVKARKLDARLAAETKKAREQMTREIKTLREQARKLASQLKSTLGDAGKRDQALKEARAKSPNSSWNSVAKPQTSGASLENSRISPRNRPIEPLPSSVLTPRMPQSLLRLNWRHRPHHRSRVRRARRPTSHQ